MRLISHVYMDYSQFAPKQLAHPTNSPHYQLAPLILPTRPTSTTNSPHVVCLFAPVVRPTRPTCLISTRPTSPTVTNSPPVFANSPHS